MRSFLVALASVAISQVAALGTSCSAALTPQGSASSPYWLHDIAHLGTSAFNANPGSYQVFRNVLNFGATGNGVTDDTAAINSAISTGNRCGGSNGCQSSTLTPALVYFPPGTYLVSSPIIALYYTALVGDKKNPPTFKATAGFSGIAVIDADPYVANGQYYINQNNFFRTVRNFHIDLTAIPASSSATGLHWQVAQATSLVNVAVTMSTASGNNHQGIFMENGSGGVMSDLVFTGGKFGIWVGNQQFTVRNITVNNAATGVYALWNWGWTFQGVTFNNCGVGFEINTGGPQQNPPGQTIGAESILDAVVTNTPTFLQTTTSERTFLSGSLFLENIVLNNVPNAVVDASGTVLAGGTTTIAQWAQGYTCTGTSGCTYHQGTVTKPTKPSQLTANGKIFGRSRNQYEGYAVTQFQSVKAAGAKGDGHTDDTAALQAVINQWWGCKIIYVDAGTYVITSTLTIPAGTFVVGELWSNIQASGSYFANANSPQVAVRVGAAGSTAATEISDIVFTSVSGSAGAILVEWNVGSTSQGSAAMWDSHVRLGGYTGSNIQVGNCGTGTSHPTAACTAAYLSLHVTSGASAYFENVWLWTADHDLDDPNQGQIDVFSGRGMLIETANAVWLLGTASEHHALYNYNIYGAKGLYIALIQVETPYWQPSPAVPAPFTTNTAYHDPAYYSSETSAWGLAIHSSSNVYAYGVNLYSFFQNYSQNCLNTYSCQNGILSVDSASTQIFIYNLNTVASANMIYIDANAYYPESTYLNGFTSTLGTWKSTN